MNHEDEYEMLRQQVKEQGKIIERLQEQFFNLSLCVQYNPEEPFLAFLTMHGIAGDQRIALNLVIDAVLSRAKGSPVAPLRPEAAELINEYPVLAKARCNASIDRSEAISLIAEVVGGKDSAEQALKAHYQRGLGVEGHQRLGI